MFQSSGAFEGELKSEESNCLFFEYGFYFRYQRNGKNTFTFLFHVYFGDTVITIL